MSETSECLFCRILAGEVPADVVAETDHSLAFRDISPQAPTHALVIPRRHVPDVGTLAAEAPEELADAVSLARQVAEADGLEGFRLVANTGAAAQQTVFHCHLHVLGGRELTWPPG
ncbi:histidine triad nucleotide-binding protein [Arthrobacter sp. NEB 688]|uniref:histidine triad nucleotide-binding protein n=1 Tax=Arthrobacter sp. NEB 688 TaxID=904039 RepID=UPI00156302D5|nr:histidine triad nucleotide-binding protein [Arthrobacter sp. NEB 688]QKE85199.1 histidine triad nucleotide-binding protein [Arthrobacter sp. NEB 688]